MSCQSTFICLSKKLSTRCRNISLSATYRSLCGSQHKERYGNDPQGYLDKIESEMQLASRGRTA